MLPRRTGAGFPPSPQPIAAMRSTWHSVSWVRASTVLIGLFALAVIALSAHNPPQSFESAGLLLALNLIFTTLVSLFIALLAARTFVATKQANALSLCCAMLIWGISAFIAATASSVGNVTITIHNLGVLFSALLHFTAVALTVRSPRLIANAKSALTLGCLAALVLVGVIWMSTVQSWLPTFFFQGAGGTPVRGFVLYTSAILLAAAVLGLWVEHQQRRSAFVTWYALGLAMLCVGILGVALQTVHGGLLGWTARVAQYVAGVYMLVGAAAALRQAQVLHRPLSEALLKARDEFEVLLRSINDGILLYEWVDNKSTRSLRANEVACRLLGYSREDLARRSLDEIVVFQDEAGRSGVESLRDGQIAERTLLSKQGRPIFAEISKRSFDHRRHRMTLLVMRDVSDRRRAEKALRESEEQLRLITDTAPVYLARIDLEHRYLFVNKSYAVRLGLDPDSLIGKLVPEVVGEQAYSAFRPYVERSLSGEVVEFDISVPYKGIGTQYVHATYVPERDGKGQIQGLIAAITDISARKLAEDKLRQADRRKDEFLAMLGHELRNPLGPIRTSVQIMSRVPNDSPQMKQARAVIERQVEHLTQMVDDLLDVSRITEGKISLRLDTLDLEAVLQQAIDTAKPSIDARRHVLKVSMGAQHLYVRADPVRLAQVFTNLLSNASKFTPDGGCIQICVEVEQQICRVVVRDNGIGISEELLPYVFDLFTQAERAADRAQGGLGIGLTVVRKLVELHGGRISASSRGADQGSEFSVELPLVAGPAHERPKAQDKPAAPIASKRRILVVDDNADSANSLALILKLDGHETCVAYDGEEALDLAIAFKPELVLLDIGLPGLDGYRVAQRLRAMPQTQRATVIAITGYGQPEDQRRAKEAGFDHHLVKPVDLGALAALINSTEAIVET